MRRSTRDLEVDVNNLVTSFVFVSLGSLVAACGQPENAAKEPAPASAAAPAPAAAPSGTAAAPSVRYTCTPAMALTVRYDNAAGADGKAFVMLEGKEYSLDHVPSGSGARYLAEAGRTPGATLVWWNKGSEGTLMEGKTGDPAAEEKTVATCVEAP